MVKKTGNMVRLYHEHRLIRQYVIPKGHRAYEKNDFPPVLRDMMEGEYSGVLLRRARDMGEEAYGLVESTLLPHAYLNARRAQGLLGVMEKYRDRTFFRETCRRAAKKKTIHYRELKSMFENAEERADAEPELPLSYVGAAMLRDALYYIN